VYEVKAKIWLEKDSKCVIGKGRAELLLKIKELGSLSEVAKSMGMAYSHAWMEIKEIEDAVGHPIIISSRGGKDGGSSKLNEFGEELLEKYTEEMKEILFHLEERNKKSYKL
jgi:molybdate transport system regulatory protein